MLNNKKTKQQNGKIHTKKQWENTIKKTKGKNAEEILNGKMLKIN